MNLPGADRARIEPDKIRDYLLSFEHPVGRFKAAFFARLGYSRGRWQQLDSDLRALARTGRVLVGQESDFGRKFEVRGTLTGPSGRQANVVSVWIMRMGEDFPRLITVYPGDE